MNIPPHPGSTSTRTDPLRSHFITSDGKYTLHVDSTMIRQKSVDARPIPTLMYSPFSVIEVARGVCLWVPTFVGMFERRISGAQDALPHYNIIVSKGIVWTVKCLQ